jgi:hypothetical protein
LHVQRDYARRQAVEGRGEIRRLRPDPAAPALRKLLDELERARTLDEIT